MPTVKFKNTVLNYLPARSIDRLHLSPIKLDRNYEIESPGSEIRKLYFLEEGVGSMTAMFRDGFQVEVSLFGNEAIIGASALIGTRRSLNNIYMQIPGYGFVCSVKSGAEEFLRREEFHDIILRYVQAQLVQTAQTAGCNARHRADRRMARWLLLCADRVYSSELGLTHEFLGHMIGVRRATVSATAEDLQDRGLIDYRRGRIRILDRPGLERVACECYRVVRDHLENYQQTVTAFGATLRNVG